MVRTTLEALADTVIPGRKRWPGDRAVAGAAPGPGAVEAGALEVLTHPAPGVADVLPPLAGRLSQHAMEYAQANGLELDPQVPPFVALPFEHRTRLLLALVAPGHPEKAQWVSLVLFSNMAYESAPHRHTAEAIADGHPGLTAMGFAKPDPDGLWRFPDHSYRRELARRHPLTTPSGSPA